MLKTLIAFVFALWSLALPAMAAGNLSARGTVQEKPAHCALMDTARDAPDQTASDLPDCCRVPAPLLTELGVLPPPAFFEAAQFDPPTDDRAASFAAAPELPPPRA